MPSADNPLADQMNAIGMQGLMGPNPYSSYQNRIPPMGGYQGWPSNALGQQIAPTPGMSLNPYNYSQAAPGANRLNYPYPPSAVPWPGQSSSQSSPTELNSLPAPPAGGPPGTTLNSNPASMPGTTPGAGTPGAGSGFMLDPRSGQNASLYAVDPSKFTEGQGALAVNPQTGQTLGQAQGTLRQYYGSSPISQIGGTQEGMYGGGGGGMVGGQMVGMSPADMTRISNAVTGAGQQAPPASGGPTTSNAPYLSLLANPGQVTTPGVGPAGQSPQWGGQPSVLSSFLAQNKGGMGAGNYNNQPFFNALGASNLGSTGNPPMRPT